MLYVHKCGKTTTAYTITMQLCLFSGKTKQYYNNSEQNRINTGIVLQHVLPRNIRALDHIIYSMQKGKIKALYKDGGDPDLMSW